jgi:hypothetical protein
MIGDPSGSVLKSAILYGVSVVVFWVYYLQSHILSIERMILDL